MGTTLGAFRSAAGLGCRTGLQDWAHKKAHHVPYAPVFVQVAAFSPQDSLGFLRSIMEDIRKDTVLTLQLNTPSVKLKAFHTL